MISAENIRNLVIPIITAPFTLQDLAARIANIFALIGGIIAFIFLILSGITYITAGSNAEQAKKARDGIINVVIGIIVIALSYVLIRVVISFLVDIIR